MSRCRWRSSPGSTSTARRISVAKEYADTGVQLDASKLKAAFEKKKAEGKEIKAAMTFPGGTHDLWIRYWLAAGGIDPDKDVSTIVVPPPQMVANMKVGNMDVFCVGEPWNEQLVNQGIGFTAATTGELWKGHPEKALGLRADWIEKNPERRQGPADGRHGSAAMVRKHGQQGRRWLTSSASANGSTCRPKDISAASRATSTTAMAASAKATDLYMKFWKDGASYPFKSHDTWFMAENIRWGNLRADTDIKALVDQVNREDIWREAAKDLGVAAADIPASSSRGKETFFDGKVFDPENPSAYLDSLVDQGCRPDPLRRATGAPAFLIHREEHVRCPPWPE